MDKLSQIKFPNYKDFGNINAAYSNFVELVLNTIDEIAPIKEIRIRKDTQEWMDQEVLEKINIRDGLFIKFKSTKNSLDYQNFKTARNRVQTLIKSKKIFH